MKHLSKAILPFLLIGSAFGRTSVLVHFSGRDGFRLKGNHSGSSPIREACMGPRFSVMTSTSNRRSSTGSRSICDEHLNLTAIHRRRQP